MESQWITLPAVQSSVQSLPHLLIQYSFNSDSYNVSLTDLTQIWSESLSRRNIIKRALNENTSIDPTEDNSQLRMLLETIKGPLTGTNGVLELAISTDGTTLLLRATARLPPPLNSLSWTYQLVPAPESSIKHEIIGPIWMLAYIQNRQIQDLLRRLREKDHVISKLLDSVENSNVDLSTIFPSTVGMKVGRDVSKREQAEHYVPGLGAFDEESWRQDLSKRDTKMGMAKSNSISLTEANMSIFKSSHAKSGEIRSEVWWKDLGRLPTKVPDVSEPEVHPAIQIEQAVSSTQPIQGIDDADETESDDDGYQKQATPPRLRAHKSPTPVHSVEHSKSPSDDEQERDIMTHRLQSPAKKLGRIGGRSKTPQSLAEAPSPRSSVEKGSEMEIEYSPKPPARKLGRIGGSVAKAQPTEPLQHPHLRNGQSTISSTKILSPSADQPRQQDDLTSLDDAILPQIKGKKEPAPDLEKNVEELANKKREDLRRKLQTQEQSTSKKKRRF